MRLLTHLQAWRKEEPFELEKWTSAKFLGGVFRRPLFETEEEIVSYGRHQSHVDGKVLSGESRVAG
jgi:hypothetical protein